jgi:hypothetical protein
MTCFTPEMGKHWAKRVKGEIGKRKKEENHL